MGRKADLQTDLDTAGIAYVEKDTIAVLEAKLAAGAPPPVRHPDADDGREARRQARRDEAAEASKNRADDQAAAKAEVRSAAQQAVDRGATS